MVTARYIVIVLIYYSESLEDIILSEILELIVVFSHAVSSQTVKSAVVPISALILVMKNSILS